MNKKLAKITAVTLSAALCLTAGGATFASNEAQETPEQEKPVVNTDAISEGEVTKDETVYVIASANGETEKLIVSDRLNNPAALDKIEDASELADIKTVRGGAEYASGVWQTDGGDVYYQGTSDKDLPVAVSVSYMLDGKPVSAQELAGKSGRVTIRFDYENHTGVEKQIAGKTEKVYVPFAAVTGLVLDNDVFSDVSVTSGKALNDGSRTAVVGFALPGLGEMLGETEIEIPEYFEISAQAKNFSLESSYTIVTNSVFNELDADKLSIGGLEDSVGELTDAMTKLIDGSSQLYDGVAALQGGMSSLTDGAAALCGGLNTLKSNSEALNAGAKQIFDALLSTANAQLAAGGVEVPALTVDNYSAVLNGVLASLGADGVRNTARGRVEAAVREKSEDVRAAVAAAVSEEVAAQVEAAVREGVFAKVLAAMGFEPEQYAAGVESGTVNAAQQAQVNAAVEQQMQTAEVKAIVREKTAEKMQAGDIAALVEQKTEEQIQKLVDENMQSDEVQKQIADAVKQAGAGAESINALLAQLDGVAQFYNGLTAYTAGVDGAADGAGKLKTGITALNDGVGQLADGSMQLRDGIARLNDEGISKISEVMGGKLGDVSERIKAALEASEDYTSFSGISGGMKGEVKFVYKTAAVK